MQRLDSLSGAEGGGEPGRLRFQHPPDREDLEQRIIVVHVGDERDRLEQQVRLEAGDVGAVAATHIEHTDDFERLHRFAHGVARKPEALGELLLRWKTIAGRQLAGHDHRLDLLDRLVGDSHDRHPSD